MQTTSDEREQVVISAARRGDTNAFAQLVKRYETPVYNLVYRMLGDSAEAEDGAQETFLRAYSQLTRYDPRQPFAGWLTSIATHYCIDRLRRRKYAGPSLDDEALPHEPVSELPAPDEALLADERVDEAQRLLAMLPAPYRIAVVLKYWNEMSIADIARATGETQGNIKVRLHRARQMMARAARREVAVASPVPAGGEGSHAR